MSRVGALIGYRVTGADFIWRLGLIRGNQLAARCGVVLADQRLDGNHGLVRVTEIAAAIGVGELHALYHPVQVGGAIVPIGLERIGLEDVEHLQNMNAAGRGRCRRDNLEIAKGASHWWALEHAVAGKILSGDQPIVGRHVAGNEFGGFACVKTVSPFVTDTRQGARQIRLLKQRAGRRSRVTALQVDALGLLIFSKTLGARV